MTHRYKIFNATLMTACFILLFIGIVCAPSRPTLAELPEGKNDFNALMQFLAADDLDEREWLDSYNCVDFSTDLVNRAGAVGFSAVPVRLVSDPSSAAVPWASGETSYSAHQIVAFYLADGTVVFVEPQSDQVVGIFYYPIVSAEVVE